MLDTGFGEIRVPKVSVASLKDINRRIGAVRNTQKVTRAMKLVAAAKLKRAQQTALAARSYTSGLYAAAMRVSRHLGPRAALMWRRPCDINCVDLIVVTSDRGLCGGFNENLLRIVEDEVANAKNHNIGARLYVIGKKGLKYLSRRSLDVVAVPAIADEEIIAWIVKEVTHRYQNMESAGSTIAFNRFRSASRQEPTFWNFLPLHKRGSERERHLEYLYEPYRQQAMDSLCNLTLTSSLRQVLLESRAAELAARMVAMDNATKNADDMIASLKFLYNKVRQEDITTELMDIVGGVEALKGI